ncbi:MAG TPA: hypothetical protein PK760_14340, partial [Flavobacteriales bacterium]|nr:hypothetical protein [Flavobacteriales bacterium]
MNNRYPHTFRLFSLLLPCVVFHGLRAQTLTAADVLLPEGPSYRMQLIPEVVPWDTLAGNNVTWAYDWLEVDTTDTETFRWLEPTTGQGAANYPNANYAMRSIGGTNNDYIIDTYYTLGTNGLLNIGSVGPVLSYVYETPEMEFTFPAAVGDTSGGDYCFTSDGFGIQYHFCGASYVTYDAHGTLILPYGTFTDVKHVTHWRSSWESTTSVDSSYSITQQWFLPG